PGGVGLPPAYQVGQPAPESQPDISAAGGRALGWARNRGGGSWYFAHAATIRLEAWAAVGICSESAGESLARSSGASPRPEWAPGGPPRLMAVRSRAKRVAVAL